MAGIDGVVLPYLELARVCLYIGFGIDPCAVCIDKLCLHDMQNIKFQLRKVAFFESGYQGPSGTTHV